jgi:hypothetical protein
LPQGWRIPQERGQQGQRDGKTLEDFHDASTRKNYKSWREEPKF